jgi:hypothetical protein
VLCLLAERGRSRSAIWKSKDCVSVFISEDGYYFDYAVIGYATQALLDEFRQGALGG